MFECLQIASVPCHRINKLGTHAHHRETATLQWQHSQTELIFWIALVYGNVRLAHSSILTVCDNAGRIKERAWYEKDAFV